MIGVLLRIDYWSTNNGLMIDWYITDDWLNDYWQNGPKQSWANNLIFKYIRIFWTNIFIRKNNCWFFLEQIYSDIHSWSLYHAKYIWIFICPISMVTNIYRYSFVQKIDICLTLTLYTTLRLSSYHGLCLLGNTMVLVLVPPWWLIHLPLTKWIRTNMSQTRPDQT